MFIDVASLVSAAPLWFGLAPPCSVRLCMRLFNIHTLPNVNVLISAEVTQRRAAQLGPSGPDWLSDPQASVWPASGFTLSLCMWAETLIPTILIELFYFFSVHVGFSLRLVCLSCWLLVPRNEINYSWRCSCLFLISLLSKMVKDTMPLIYTSGS